MSSIEEVEILKRRGLAMLGYARGALGRGHYDLAMFFSEQALQLFIKAVVLMLLGYTPRTHGIKELPGVVATALYELGKEDAAVKIAEASRRRRREPATLEEAYITSRHLAREFEKVEAEKALETATDLKKL
ncbi:HEPN domain-containing protein [Pyrobaculum sp.]|uniref:HEPN domain-containing protein n=1 Tax=Pyrobaculum sp. TaxID=2004705 RepID=UPI003D0FF0C2